MGTTEPTQEEVDFACYSYRHDFGIISREEQELTRFEAREWLRAWLTVLDMPEDINSRD